MKPTNAWVSKTALFLTSQMFSLFGSSVVGYVVIWYITLETSSAWMMTVSILCTFLPQLLVSLFAGVWADRYSRKLLIMLSDLFTALCTLVLAVFFLLGVRSFTLLFIISALRSLGAGVQAPAVGAILPQLVPTEKLTKVNGISNALNSALMLLSPAIGGLLLAKVDMGYALLVDVATALLAVCIMLFLKVQKAERSEESASTLGDLKKGLRYTMEHPILRRLMIFYLLFFFLVSPAAFLTPVMVERSFGPEVWRLTANEMLWTAGSLLGGVLISVWGGFKNRLATMALATAGFGVTFALLGVAGNFYLYLGIMLVSGIFMPVFGTAETVLIQETVEEQMLGRVFSIVQIIITGSMPLGMVVFGPLGDIIKIEYLLIGTGILMVLLTPFILSSKASVKAVGSSSAGADTEEAPASAERAADDDAAR